MPTVNPSPTVTLEANGKRETWTGVVAKEVKSEWTPQTYRPDWDLAGAGVMLEKRTVTLTIEMFQSAS